MTGTSADNTLERMNIGNFILRVDFIKNFFSFYRACRCWKVDNLWPVDVSDWNG